MRGGSGVESAAAACRRRARSQPWVAAWLVAGGATFRVTRWWRPPRPRGLGAVPPARLAGAVRWLTGGVADPLDAAGPGGRGRPGRGARSTGEPARPGGGPAARPRAGPDPDRRRRARRCAGQPVRARRAGGRDARGRRGAAAPDATTTVSVALLRHAAAGRVHPAARRSARRGRRRTATRRLELPRAAGALLAVGHCSGAGLLHGVLVARRDRPSPAGARRALGRRGNRPPPPRRCRRSPRRRQWRREAPRDPRRALPRLGSAHADQRRADRTSGVDRALVAMATPVNLELLADMGFDAAGRGRAQRHGRRGRRRRTRTPLAAALDQLERRARRPGGPAAGSDGTGERGGRPHDRLSRPRPPATRAWCWSPRRAGTRSSRRWTRSTPALSVMVFSDNVPVEQEVRAQAGAPPSAGCS